jgi:L-asparagine transporter-like permease
MKDATLRLFAVEHISVMIIAAVLLTIGYAKQKRTEDSATKFKRISTFYAIALLLILSRIPWAQWLD